MSPEIDARILSAALDLIGRRLTDQEGLIVVGLTGSQGSGKSTLANALRAHLLGEGIRAEAVSLDDFYLSPDERAALATTVHPLLRTRGVPGTHDMAMAEQVLGQLRAGKAAVLPRFDKAYDAPFDRTMWRPVEPGLRVLIFEGWCVSARPQPEGMLGQPVNALEASEDVDGAWRRFVNAQLAGPYAALFDQLDCVIFLAAPDFSVVQAWRLQQEQTIAGHGSQVMDSTQIARFIQHYERITQWMLEDLPGRADLVIRLGPERQPSAIEP
ncbi:MAG: kinase [Novosphingobium sp.]